MNGFSQVCVRSCNKAEARTPSPGWHHLEVTPGTTTIFWRVSVIGHGSLGNVSLFWAVDPCTKPDIGSTVSTEKTLPRTHQIAHRTAHMAGSRHRTFFVACKERQRYSMHCGVFSCSVIPGCMFGWGLFTIGAKRVDRTFALARAQQSFHAQGPYPGGVARCVCVVGQRRGHWKSRFRRGRALGLRREGGGEAFPSGVLAGSKVQSKDPATDVRRPQVTVAAW